MGFPLPDAAPRVIAGTLAVVCVPECNVTRKKDPTSTMLRKNGTLVMHTAVWCHEAATVDGVNRVRIKTPCDGWVDQSAVVVGQICVVNSLVGATVRSGIELSSEVVGEVPYEARCFVIDQDETDDGKTRAQILSPVPGWVSVKCLVPITDRTGGVLEAGKTVVSKKDAGDKSVTYSHYMELNHEIMYKALWDSGLMYGPGFQLCKRAWRTDTDAIGLLGPLPGEAVGYIVHPAMADSMLHCSAVAPTPPDGGWPWLQGGDARDED